MHTVSPACLVPTGSTSPLEALIEAYRARPAELEAAPAPAPD